MAISQLPTLDDIKQAQKRIQPHAHRTPVLHSIKVNEKTGGEIFFKCENFQKVGAFKFRGACNTVLSLSEEQAAKGVATHSSGNHAQALALAARIKGIPAFIVMPENAPKVKVQAVKDYGAEITFCEATQEAREAVLGKVVEKTWAHFVHPYNDYRIITGQATAALEFLEDYPDLDIILAPVGGGGLLSGTALATKYTRSSVKVIGCEPLQADDAYQSFKQGKLIPVKNPNTIADGLKTSLGELPFSIIKEFVDDIVILPEESIVQAMKFIWERMKIIIEPSSAVPVAALLKGIIDVESKKVGVIISGGNVDLDNLPW
ncbi:MAG: pyridoxal-phosphate dependent enzyme [Balneolaceae bacterium]